jgi:hypothetical protein
MIEFILDLWSISLEKRGIETVVAWSRYKKVKFFFTVILALMVFRYFSWDQIFRTGQNKKTDNWDINTCQQGESDALFLHHLDQQCSSFFLVIKSIFVLDSFPLESKKLNHEIPLTYTIAPMNRINLLSIAMFVISISCFSQSDFREGFVVQSSGDTLQGWVNYVESKDQYRKCRFKPSKDTEATDFLPDQIAGYGFLGDKVFESGDLETENNSNEEVFYQVLVRGNVTLFKHNNIFFVRGPDSLIRKLDNSKSQTESDGREYATKSQRYIGTLSYMFQDCADLQGKLADLRYSEKKLTEVVEAYNICQGDDIQVYKSQKKWFKAELAVALGYNASKIKFDTSISDYQYLTEDFEIAGSVMPGISLNVASPRINERFSFYLGAFYLKTDYKSNSIINQGVVEQRNYLDIRIEQIKLPIGVRYAVPFGQVTSFINGGFSYTAHLSKSVEGQQERKINETIETREIDELVIDNSQFGYWIGLGVQHQTFKKAKLFLEARVEKTSGILATVVVNNTVLSDSITNFQLIVGLNLW